MSEVVAISPATSTLAPRPMNTPAGLISQICPFGIENALQVMIALTVDCVSTYFVGDGVDSVAPPDTTLNPESPLDGTGEPAAALPENATNAVVASKKPRSDRDARLPICPPSRNCCGHFAFVNIRYNFWLSPTTIKYSNIPRYLRSAKRSIAWRRIEFPA